MQDPPTDHSNAVLKRVPHLRNAQRKYIQSNLNVIKELQDELNKICLEKKTDPTRQGKLEAANKVLTDSFKEYHNHMSKFSKELDKFIEGEKDQYESGLHDILPDNATKRLLAQYLCQKALPRSTHTLIANWSESSRQSHTDLSLTEGAQSYLQEMPPVVQSLQRGDLETAERWVYDHRNHLGRLVTYDLTFDITRIRFLKLIAESFSNERLEIALQFAQKHISIFYDRHEKEIKKLMSALLSYGMEQSQFPQEKVSVEDKSTALHDIRYYINRLKITIMKHCAKINSLPGDGVNSNLEILLNSGAAASNVVNTALQFVIMEDNADGKSSKKRKKSLLDLGQSGLPVDFKIKEDQRYHSVFCCPVSRQPPTESDPPVLLSCGHAILMSSMKNLPRRAGKFKCPTCYGISEESAVLKLVF